MNGMSNSGEVMLTEEYLAEVEARCAAATEGPWVANGIGVFPAMIDSAFQPPVFKSYENAEFTAHARLDVPTLVAEVRRLRGEVEILRLCADAEATAFDESNATVRDLRSENERLRAEVARLTTKLETK